MNRRHIFLLILLCSSLSITQAQQTSIVVRCTPPITAVDPLFVLDGEVVTQDQIKELNPLNISSIDILRPAQSAALFGCQAAQGCIIITTKWGRRRVIQLYDLVSGKMVANANFSISNNQTPSPVIADSFSYRTENIQPGTNYCIRANAPGYLAFTGFNTFQQRDTLRIGLTPIPAATVAASKKSESHPVQFSLFPNPTRRDGIANLRLVTDKPVLLRVLDMQGRVIMQQPAATSGTTQLAGLTGGMYSVQVVSTEGITLDVKKLCIQ